MLYIVHGETREPRGSVSVTTNSQRNALKAAVDFLDQGISIVTITGDGRTYTPTEFALALGEKKCADRPA